MNPSTPAYSAVLNLFAARTGFAFTPASRPAAEMGIRRVMERSNVEDPGRYHELISAGMLPLDDLIDELRIGETYFFREPDQFRFIREAVLPDIRRRHGPKHVVRIWSAGCASGEEVYSLAMVCDEEGCADRCLLLGTDFSEEALAKARRASYGEWSLRGEGAAIARRHLQRPGACYEVVDAIRRRVTFARLNLAGGEYPPGTGGMDLILCRNVLIYLDAEAIGRVAMSLHESLATGGWLITASTDPPLNEHAPFARIATPYGVFYRRAAATSAPVALPGRARSAEPAPDGRGRLSRPGPGGEAIGRPPESSNAGEVDAVRRIRDLANSDVLAAERACADAIEVRPLSFELHQLRSVLLLGIGRHADAAHAIRRALYLEPSSMVAHLLLGAILRRGGDAAGARRAYRNAQALGERHPAGEPVPHSDGEGIERLIAVAEAELARLDGLAGPKS